MNKIAIVLKHTYRKLVMSWSFILMTLSPIIMMLVVAGIVFIIGRDVETSTQGKLAIINASSEMIDYIDKNDQINEKQYELSLEGAQESLVNGEIDGILEIITDEKIEKLNYYRQNTDKDINFNAIITAINQYNLDQVATKLKLESDQLTALNDVNVDINEINISASKDGEITEDAVDDVIQGVKNAAAFAVNLVLFLFIIFYVSIIAQEIATEKGARIMEIIISSVTPTQHFLGKIIGVFLMILTQLLFYGVLLIGIWYSGVVQYLIGDLPISFELVQEVFNTSKPILIYGFIFAIIGIINYTFLAGFLGSLVSKVEDVQKAIAPITMIALVGYYIGAYAMTSTNNIVVRTGSMIPLISPYIMPFRIAAGTIPTGDIIISILLSLVFAIVTVWVSVLFYKNNVLSYSEKGILDSLRQSFTMLKSERRANK